MAITDGFPKIDVATCERVEHSGFGLIDIEEVSRFSDASTGCGQSDVAASLQVN